LQGKAGQYNQVNNASLPHPSAHRAARIILERGRQQPAWSAAAC